MSEFAIPLGLVGYLFACWCLWRMAKNFATGDEWMAWVPLANLFILFRIARRPAWGVLLLLMPLVNIVVIAIVFMRIAERCNLSPLYGMLLFIPLFNLLFLYELSSASHVTRTKR